MKILSLEEMNAVSGGTGHTKPCKAHGNHSGKASSKAANASSNKASSKAHAASCGPDPM